MAKASKTKRLETVVANALANPDYPKPAEPTPAKEAQDQSPAQGDQKRTRDQKSAGGKKKRSATHLAWMAQPDFKPEQKIVKVNDNSKRRDSQRRFSFYKPGMSVAEYQDVMAKNGGTKKLAMKDMRWDYVKGLIVVE